MSFDVIRKEKHKYSGKQGSENWCCRAPDKVCIFIFKTSISWPNPRFDHLLESSRGDHLLESSPRDDSNKWSNLGFCQEIKEIASIEIHFTHLIWRSALDFLIHTVTLSNKNILQSTKTQAGNTSSIFPSWPRSYLVETWNFYNTYQGYS